MSLKGLKGTLSRVDMRSSIHSLRDLSRSTAIMEISVSWRILHILCIKSSLSNAKMLSLSKANSPLSSTFSFRPELMRLPPCPDPPLDAILKWWLLVTWKSQADFFKFRSATRACADRDRVPLRRCYTAKCFVQLVSQCFGDIVAGQVARNISQCNIPCNSQNRCETSCTKSRT